MAAGSTYTPIATTTLGSAAASYTFSSISGSYTDLVLVAGNLAAASASNAFKMQVNADTATNYSNTYLSGNGSTAISGRNSSADSLRGFDNPNPIGPAVVTAHFMNYSNTTTYKTVLSRCSAAGYSTTAEVNLWRNTAAITSIKIFFAASGNDIQAGTTFTLYGIAAA
jgi:hypothetical protein